MIQKKLWLHVETVRKQSPLVHNITNFVVMNNTANALLAIGASPIMAHAKSEVQEMVQLSQVLVVNIGTLDEYWVESMLLAAEKAQLLGKPWVLDPVGAGATSFRDQTLQRLLVLRPSVIRGNASEILAVAKANSSTTKGVDSTVESVSAMDTAKNLAKQYGNVICVSGARDVITDGRRVAYVENGHALMTKVTGVGCSASALIGAFVAVIQDRFEATVAAMSLIGLAGELAQKETHGPGGLQLKLLDKLYTMTENEFMTHVRVSES